MSMHLCGPALTTTSYKKRKERVTKSQQEELERGWRARNQRLKEIKLPKETFEQYLEWVYGKGKKEKGQKNPGKKITKASAYTPVETNSPIIDSSKDPTSFRHAEAEGGNTVTSTSKSDLSRHGRLWVTGPCASKPSPTYTGTKIIGIGTMHKSNIVPIFSDEEAVDIARMRR